MRRVYLREIADIQTGPFGSQLHKEDYVEVGTPIVTVEHLGNRIFSEQNLPKVSASDKRRLSKYVLAVGDIVFSRVGSVDRCSYVDEAHDGWMFSGRCLRVRPFERVNPLYLYYFFCMEETKQFIRSIAVGATMPSINTSLLGEVTVPLPEVCIQRKIASVLSAIDSKIETNQRINDNLAQQLQCAYMQQYGNSDQINGTLADICAYTRDRIAVSAISYDNYFSTENMLPNKQGYIAASSLPTTEYTPRCEPGQILVSNIRPYFKKIILCRDIGGCSADVLCFSAKHKLGSAYVYSTLYADRFFDFMVAGSKGTKMPRGDKQQIMQYPVHVPTEDELETYRCTKCRRKHTEKVPEGYPGTRITERAAAWVKSLLLNKLPIKAIQGITGIHWETIRRIHKDMLETTLSQHMEKLKASGYKPRYLAVDEFAIHKGHTYATCVMDLETGEVLWVGSGRSKEDFARFFDEIDPSFITDIRAIAMDMNASYHILIKQKLPNAQIVYE